MRRGMPRAQHFARRGCRAERRPADRHHLPGSGERRNVRETEDTNRKDRVVGDEPHQPPRVDVVFGREREDLCEGPWGSRNHAHRRRAMRPTTPIPSSLPLSSGLARRPGQDSTRASGVVHDEDVHGSGVSTQRSAALEEALGRDRPFPDPSEDALIGLNRLATVARLLSGAAHEVNNALQVISGTVEILESRSDVPASLSDALTRLRT